LLTTFGNLVGFWWVVVNSPEPKISRPLENCSPIFSHANTRFKQALQQLEAKHPRRLRAIGTEIDHLLRRFEAPSAG
jgi:hypothetical protein